MWNRIPLPVSGGVNSFFGLVSILLQKESGKNKDQKRSQSKDCRKQDIFSVSGDKGNGQGEQGAEQQRTEAAGFSFRFAACSFCETETACSEAVPNAGFVEVNPGGSDFDAFSEIESHKDSPFLYHCTDSWEPSQYKNGATEPVTPFLYFQG